MSYGVMFVPDGKYVKVFESSISLIVLSVSWTISVVILKAVPHNGFEKTIVCI